jgi:hypothetical protein
MYSKYNLAVILGVMITLVCMPLQQLVLTSSDYLDYENMTYGIRIQYPSDWRISEDNNNTSNNNATSIASAYSEINADLNIIAEFLAPVQSKYFKPNDPNTHNSIGIVVENYTSSSPPSSSSATSLSSLDTIDKQLSDFGKNRIASIVSVCPDLEIISMNKSAILSNSPAHQVTYNYSHEGTMNKANEIWTVRDDKAYLVAYGGHESFYDMYLPDIQRIFDSFEIDR